MLKRFLPSVMKLSEKNVEWKTKVNIYCSIINGMGQPAGSPESSGLETCTVSVG